MNTIKNNINLMGHLGMDPEIKRLDGGKTLAKVRVATNEVYKNREGQRVTTTQWHNCIAWGRQAELIEQLLKKGSEVVILGRLNYRSYEDKEGKNRQLSEIVIQEFSLTGKKKEA